MTYTIFVSHTGLDRKIAEDIKKLINDAFLGQIGLYLALHELRAGMNWKDEIKQRLKNYDAIISIVTPRSLSKAWIYIEWTAFWLKGKPTYILLTDEVQPAHLVSPMSDLQTVTMSKLDQVKLLFESLAKDSKSEGAIPYDFAEKFVARIKYSDELVRQEVAEQGYGKYKNTLSDLPSDNSEKGEIAEYFIEQGDFDTFERILAEITSDQVKSRIAKKLISAGDESHTALVIRSMQNSVYLKSVGKALADFGYANTALMKELTDSMGNQAEKRGLAKHILSIGKDYSDTLQYIINQFDNMAELYKLGLEFLDHGLSQPAAFEDLVTRLGKRHQTELVKLAKVFVDRNITDKPEFEVVIRNLEQSQRKPLIAYWIQNNRQSAQGYSEKNSVSNPQFTQSLKRALT